MALGPEGANGKQTNGQVMRESDEGLCTEGKKKNLKGGGKGGSHFSSRLHDFWRKKHSFFRIYYDLEIIYSCLI